MAEYIEREKVLEIIKNSMHGYCIDSYERGWDKALEAIGIDFEHILAADVRPEKHGHWMPVYSNNYARTMGFASHYNCSVCNCEVDYIEVDFEKYSRERHYEFCPRCGARMDGKNG